MKHTNCLALLVLACVPAIADDYAALYHEAAEAIEWNIQDNWAFTETRLVDGLPWVARFDPRRSGTARWTLLSVDGREPTAAELGEFREDKSDDQGTSDSSNRIDIVAADTLELIDEDDASWTFRFIPNEDETVFVDNVDATVRIRKEGPWLEFIDLRNHSDIKPGFGTRIRTFLVNLEFGPAIDNGPIVPKHMEIRVSGRTMLVLGFSETELIRYSNFTFAGERS